MEVLRPDVRLAGIALLNTDDEWSYGFLDSRYLCSVRKRTEQPLVLSSIEATAMSLNLLEALMRHIPLFKNTARIATLASVIVLGVSGAAYAAGAGDQTGQHGDMSGHGGPVDRSKAGQPGQGSSSMQQGGSSSMQGGQGQKPGEMRSGQGASGQSGSSSGGSSTGQGQGSGGTGSSGGSGGGY